jgi:hypothetical protein
MPASGALILFKTQKSCRNQRQNTLISCAGNSKFTKFENDLANSLHVDYITLADGRRGVHSVLD